MELVGTNIVQDPPFSLPKQLIPDDLGRTTTASNGIATTHAEYDARGLMTAQRLITGDADKSFEYAYDAAGNMTSTTDEQGATSYQYDPAGRLAAKTYPNSLSTQYAYDGAGKLSSLQIANPAHTLKTYAIDRNPRGDATRLLEDGSGETTYAYDASARLIGESSPWSGNASYSYDADGNRTSKAVEGRPAVTYTYDEADQLIADSEGCSYSYNGTGELTGKEKDGHSTQYTWDGKGRLSAIIEPGGETSTFFHDPYDRTLAYMRGEEGQVFIHSLKTDKEIATLDMQMGLSCLYSVGADGLISTTSSSETSYASFNPHSDLALTTDASGTPVSQLHYDAWGNCAEESQEPFGYLGKWQRRQHESDGLIKMGARYYDPDLGRFISKDPLGGNSVVPSATNVYAYANNNPVGMLDLNGLAATGEGNPSTACSQTASSSSWKHAEIETEKISTLGITGRLAVTLDLLCKESYSDILITGIYATITNISVDGGIKAYTSRVRTTWGSDKTISGISRLLDLWPGDNTLQLIIPHRQKWVPRKDCYVSFWVRWISSGAVHDSGARWWHMGQFASIVDKEKSDAVVEKDATWGVL